jgi:hypothetical protein
MGSKTILLILVSGACTQDTTAGPGCKTCAGINVATGSEGCATCHPKHGLVGPANKQICIGKNVENSFSLH